MRGNSIHISANFDDPQKERRGTSSVAQALEVGTPDLLAKARLGDLLRRSGKLDAAIQKYKEALDQQSNMIEAHNGLGMALHGLERFDQAITQYRKGLAHRPNDPDLHNNLAQKFHLKGEFNSH